MHFSENIERLRPSATIAVSSLAGQLRREGRDIIDLSAGEPDFDTPDWMSEAAISGIRNGATRYTPSPGIPELRKAIAQSLSRRMGREAEWGGVVVSCGAKHSLFNACFSLFGPGDEVLVAAPYWTSYPEIVSLARAEPVPVAGDEARNFILTPDDLEAARTERTKGLLLCSPCNPTGAVYSKSELQAVAEWARDHDVWLISDEIYRRIYFGDEGDEATGVLELPAESVGPYVLIDGVSKSYAMTGWRIGFSYAPIELARKISALQSHTTSNPAAPSQLAALAAYSDPERASSDVASMLDAFRRRRNLVTDLMDRLLPGYAYVKPTGAFYLFFRTDSAYREGMGSQEFCSWLLEETGVALVPGAAFGDDRYVRMSFATSDDLIEKAIQRMASALSSSTAPV